MSGGEMQNDECDSTALAEVRMQNEDQGPQWDALGFAQI